MFTIPHRHARRRLIPPLLLLLAALMAGCGGTAATRTTSGIDLDASRYAAAFDAVVETARDAGFEPRFRDRRSGIVETAPLSAATILESPRHQGESLPLLVENTVSNQRRRVRFEFEPADAAGARPAVADHPDVLATATELPDLTRHAGVLTLRVRVILEREYRRGMRRSTWTRSKTSRTGERYTDGLLLEDADTWTPVSRDPALEARLLELVRQRLDES